MNTYQDVYNIGILNDVHFLFPELLYDNIIFPNSETNNILSWIRYKLTRLYPNTFHRNRVEYLRTRAVNSRNDYDDWGFLLNRASLVMPPNSRRNVIITEPNAVPMSPIQTRIIPRTSDALVDFIMLMINQPGTFEDPVPVAPSAEQLANATEIIQRTNEVNQQICTICQSSESSPRNNEWRIIKSCRHSFHRACIDRWFTEHCRCPVCRVDIRIVNSVPVSTEQTATDPPTTQSEMVPPESNQSP